MTAPALPPCVLEADHVRFFVDPAYAAHLADLPWSRALESWSPGEAHFLDVRCGVSRHVVRFVESGGTRFAVKETTFDAAHREFLMYRRLAALGLPTLDPLGVVERDDGREGVPTPVGMQIEERRSGYLVTHLMEKVVPDSLLFRRAFAPESRRRIWDAVIDLFVRLHAAGVYWGDASLANMLIRFDTVAVPGLGTRTILAAVLADAETVELRPALSASLRTADLEFFLESMRWTEADLLAAGSVRDTVLTEDDQSYIRTRYHNRWIVEQEMLALEKATSIDVDLQLGTFEAGGYGPLLLRHIDEHKWYLSERRGKEVSRADAARSWYGEVFLPVCRLLREQGLVQVFPEKTAASLYVEIMEHKYYMSRGERRDVGLVTALHDYLRRFAPSRTPVPFLEQLARSLADHLEPLLPE